MGHKFCFKTASLSNSYPMELLVNGWAIHIGLAAKKGIQRIKAICVLAKIASPDGYP